MLIANRCKEKCFHLLVLFIIIYGNTKDHNSEALSI
jgi:hypothetical protein